MVRFVDTATIIRKDSCEGNTDRTDHQTIGKKRVASTPHSKHLKGTKKHSSGTDGNEDDHPDEKIRSFFAKDIDSVRNYRWCFIPLFDRLTTTHYDR